ncbi:hypothetical protein [Christiangramia crocea]|uniref:Uncharacterized protein n=1 Tax=Christiangramia crocea TaxID=2904124 RepID=A0A9X1UV74_9FLAO|nr:hypothetical protein [Gramella crocea]MCG9970992.1 hypothetical protein [Gramella crocea]
MTSGLLDTAFKSIDKVTNELTEVAQKSVKNNEGIITALNTANLFSGKNALDQSLDSIGGKYKPITVEIKKEKGQPYNRTTLRDTGDFYEGFFVGFKGTTWEVESEDSKRDKLVERYGKDIFGNTPKDEKTINDKHILPDLLEHILENVEI